MIWQQKEYFTMILNPGKSELYPLLTQELSFSNVSVPLEEGRTDTQLR